MRPISLLITILFSGMFFVGCSSSGTGSEDGVEEETEQYTLSVSPDPSEGGTVNPADETYEEETRVTVEATASEGWTFTEWSGDQSSTENPLSFTINSDTDLMANFEEATASYSFTASASPTESGTVSPEDTTVNEGTKLSVEATAQSGWQFTEWSGDLSSTENPLSITVTQDTEITGNFEQVTQQYNFLAQPEPAEGGSVNPSEGTYEDGAEVSVEATPNNGWQFTRWSGDVSSTDNPLSLTITEETEIIANFEEVISRYNFSATTRPADGGSVDPENGTFDEGSQVMVEATAAEGWTFTGWTGDVESNENPLEFTIESDTDITANFEKKNYRLSTTVAPSDAGSVDPPNGTFEHGTEVTIEATPNEERKFTDWSGDISSTDNPLTFTITENTSITGNFERVTPSYDFSATVIPTEGGSVSPKNGTFEEGTEVIVEAIASEGWTFTEWTGDINSTDNPLSFNINSDTDVAANFEQEKSEYSFSLTVRDSEDSIELAFGQTEGATDGFDSGIDTEAPPPPPEGALNAFFEGQGRRLLDDFRAATANSLTWMLNYQVGSGDELTLTWSLDETQLNGTVILTDSNGSFQVNMQNETEFIFDPSAYEQLLIEYEVQN